MITKEELFEVSIPTPDGKGIAEKGWVKITVEWDDEIGEWLVTPESLKKIDRVKAEMMGIVRCCPTCRHLDEESLTCCHPKNGGRLDLRPAADGCINSNRAWWDPA